MKTRTKLPGWIVVALDILLCASMLLTFAYFHHARMLLGVGAKEEPKVIQSFNNDKNKENDKDNGNTGDPSEGGTDDHGDDVIVPAHVIHIWQAAETLAPTCTEGGYTLYACTGCDETKIDDRTPPTGHSAFVVKNAKEASDTENGYTGDTYCGVCGALVVSGKEIPSTGHAPEDLVLINVSESTCTTHGYTGDWFCKECMMIVASGAEIPLADHKYTAVQTVKADCVHEGYTKMKCSVCGDETITDQHPKTDHAFEVSSVVAPDCQKTGYTVMKCAMCGLEVKTDPLPKAGHTPDAHGYCTVCGVSTLDTSGDFGVSFPYVFAYGDTVSISGDEEIRAYAAENGLELSDVMEGDPLSYSYISLYRSHDVYVTLREVNTDWYYAPTNRIYRVQYYVYDVYVRNIENLFTSNITSGNRVPMEDLIERGEEYSGGTVVAAVNGDYLGNQNYCLVAERNGDLLRCTENVIADVCVLYYDGSIETYTPATYDWEEIASKNPYQIWNFGPAMLDDNGEVMTEYDSNNSIIDARHPRTGLGYYEPGHYALVVVDGRSDDSKGVRIQQLADLMYDLGCVRAFNMDGGDSSQAYMLGEDIRVDEDRTEQRKLYDIICIGEVVKP